MQESKTSSTDLEPVGKRRSAATVNEVVPFEPFDEFVFSLQDPNAVTRENIAAVAREVFGGGPETAEFIAKLVEHMLAVSESRAKIVAELVILGGHLQQMMKSTISHHTGRVGNTFQAQRKVPPYVWISSRRHSELRVRARDATSAATRSSPTMQKPFGSSASAN